MLIISSLNAYVDNYISHLSNSPSLNLIVLEQENQNQKGTQHLNRNNEMLDLLMIGSLMFPPLDQSGKHSIGRVMASISYGFQ